MSPRHGGDTGRSPPDFACQAAAHSRRVVGLLALLGGVLVWASNAYRVGPLGGAPVDPPASRGRTPISNLSERERPASLGRLAAWGTREVVITDPFGAPIRVPVGFSVREWATGAPGVRTETSTGTVRVDLPLAGSYFVSDMRISGVPLAGWSRRIRPGRDGRLHVVLTIPHRARLFLQDEESGLPTAQPEVKVVERAVRHPPVPGPVLPPEEATDVPADPESSSAELTPSGSDRVVWARGRGRAWTRFLLPPTSADVSMTVSLAPGGDIDVLTSGVSATHPMLRVMLSGRDGPSVVRCALDGPTLLRGLPLGTALLSAVGGLDGAAEARNSVLVGVTSGRRPGVRVGGDETGDARAVRSVSIEVRVPAWLDEAVRSGRLRVIGLSESGVALWRTIEAFEDEGGGRVRTSLDLPVGRYAVECIGYVADPVLEVHPRVSTATVEFRERHDVEILVRSRRDGSPVQASIRVLGLVPTVAVGFPSTDAPVDRIVEMGTMLEAQTDGHGRVVIGLPTGRYRAWVTSSDGSATAYRFVVQDEEPSRVEIELDHSMALEVELSDGLRDGQSSWVSRVYALDRASAEWDPRVRDQSEPRHIHGDLPPGTYYIEASGSDWEWSGQVHLSGGHRARVLVSESLTWIPTR